MDHHWRMDLYALTSHDERITTPVNGYEFLVQLVQISAHQVPHLDVLEGA